MAAITIQLVPVEAAAVPIALACDDEPAPNFLFLIEKIPSMLCKRSR